MKKILSLVNIALGCSLMFAMKATVLAQSTAGTISGTVIDPSGALVPEAQVIIANESGFSETLRTSSTGTFELRDLAPGSYTVSINATGFTSALENAQVVKERITREDVKLRIAVDQEIDVFAGDDVSEKR